MMCLAQVSQVRKAHIRTPEEGYQNRKEGDLQSEILSRLLISALRYELSTSQPLTQLPEVVEGVT